MPVAANSTMPVTIGEHTITAEQAGYRKAQQAFTAEAGAVATVTLTLERTSSVLNILTTPADVDVSVDGVKRGKTTVGPPPPAFADAIARAKVTPAQVSAVMVIADVPAGTLIRTGPNRKSASMTAARREQLPFASAQTPL